MTIVKLPKMQRSEIWELISGQLVCRIAFKGAKYPYVAPFQYVFMNGTLYFHFTDYGRKMSLLEKSQEVSVEIEDCKSDMSEYQFVVLSGKLSVVTETHERTEAIEKMAEDGRKKLSANFLAAHGLKKEEGWVSLSPEKPLVILKLVDVVEELGLKSP